MELKQVIRFCAPGRRISNLVVARRKVPLFVGSVGDGLPTSVKPQMIDDPIVSGVLEAEPDLYAPPAEAIEEFANCLDDIDAVCRFTRRFGVLGAEKEGKFAFLVSDWRSFQRQFRCSWDGFLGLDTRYPAEIVPYLKENAPHLFAEPFKSVQAVGRFEMTAKGLSFVADSLYAVLVLTLIAVQERGVLRHCLRPGCDEPYFIARHHLQRYCNEKCAAWGQAQAKSAWWKEKGKDWAQQQTGKTSPKVSLGKKTKRGEKDGTQKAR